MSNVQRHLVIGEGEVGRALVEVLSTEPLRYIVRSRDLDPPAEPIVTDVLHIAYPYLGDGFVQTVRDYAIQHAADLVIIHSTVPPGTSSRAGAVHSPVTGRHPNLALGIRTFVKYFGGLRAREAAAIFAALGVRTATTERATTTELGKLMATLQFGMAVALQRETYALAALTGADPDVAYRGFNELYNDGYADLDEPFRLPIIEPMPGPIGGHCVIPNAHLLARALGSPLASALIEYNELLRQPAVEAI